QRPLSPLPSLFCYFSIPGASGQYDELPGSMDHQASVQQPSGDYFSLENPSDGEALYETSSGENTLSEHGSSEHTAVEHASGEHDAVEHASGGHSAVKHASRGHAAGGHAAGEHASSEQPSGEKTSGERSAGEQPSGIPPSSTISGEPHLDGCPSLTSGPVLNCHTCSYMNDQGKCLQGEGVCSTQNSQQCMLKKIFEGGKLQFIVQGCENMCPSMNHLSHGTRMQVICCRNQSFCNKV
uniref:Acrosomal vesicle protein 1 n=1 Tax=Monodon monoceros TaxID=40151 RepID=A0A8C6BV00_MONMO